VANPDVWKQMREMIAAPYRTHGYIDAKIDAVPVLDRAGHTVDYTITVQSGPVYHMGKLTVANLNDRQKAEVMPYWQMREGDAFNTDLIPKFMADYHKSRAEQLQSIRGWAFDAKWSGNKDTHSVDVVLTFTPPAQ
jgi:outer membrane protein assembly factor BamA